MAKRDDKAADALRHKELDPKYPADLIADWDKLPDHVKDTWRNK